MKIYDFFVLQTKEIAILPEINIFKPKLRLTEHRLILEVVCIARVNHLHLNHSLDAVQDFASTSFQVCIVWISHLSRCLRKKWT